jgi:hypothetical protein
MAGIRGWPAANGCRRLAVGFNLADVTPKDVGSLPAGVKGLVWLGDTIGGATAAFQATINSLIGNPNVYGFYMADEPGPGYAANLKAESDYIHAHDPGAKTFIVLLNNGSDASPEFSYNPANTDIDLFGLDPYPVQTGGVNYSSINTAVAAAEAQGIPQSQIVPVYQLDFIEKYAASPRRRDVKDCFLPEDLAGTFEGEPEASEVSERAPASPHVGPVE